MAAVERYENMQYYGEWAVGYRRDSEAWAVEQREQTVANVQYLRDTREALIQRFIDANTF